MVHEGINIDINFTFAKHFTKCLLSSPDKRYNFCKNYLSIYFFIPEYCLLDTYLGIGLDQN